MNTFSDNESYKENGTSVMMANQEGWVSFSICTGSSSWKKKKRRFRARSLQERNSKYKFSKT